MSEVENVKFVSGLYRVKWTEEWGGGYSLAAVGQLPNGRYWIAPTNWVNGSVSLDSQMEKIEEMVKIRIQVDNDE